MEARDFIPYEQALALKELGFDEPCMTFYNYDKKIERSDDWAYGVTYKDKRERNECLAPTFSQAFRFFREKYGLYNEICIGHDEDKLWWNYYIYKIELGYDYDPINDDNESGVDTYEEAELECLNKLIEIVKQKVA